MAKLDSDVLGFWSIWASMGDFFIVFFVTLLIMFYDFSDVRENLSAVL